jgi:putative FmdB family regulatory protein
MPTYEYKCDACGHAFEKFQPMSSAPIRRCPKCGRNRVRRLIGTGAGLIFKGSGFYITDYRDPSYKEKAKAESGDAKPSENKDNAKSDSKDGDKATKVEKSDAKSAEPAVASAKSEKKPQDKPKKKK